MTLLWVRALVLAAFAGGVAWAAGSSGDDTRLKVKVGQPTPDITLQATQVESVLPQEKGKKELRLSDLKGKNVVLYFFPKALTGG